MIFHNIFDQINPALLSIINFFQNHKNDQLQRFEPFPFTFKYILEGTFK